MEEKKFVKYKGITRLPSDHDSFDGELEDVVNMSITEGELRPVLPPELIGTIPGQFKFVHKNQGYEHFIYLDGNVVKAYKYENGALTAVTCSINISNATLKKIDAVGNTLIILTSLDIIYALCRDNKYTALGSNIPSPIISFNLSAAYDSSYDKIVDLMEYEGVLTSTQGLIGYFYKLRNITGVPFDDGSDTFPVSNETLYNTGFREYYIAKTGIESNVYHYAMLELEKADNIISPQVNNISLAYINKSIKSLIAKDYFVFPFFIRYAIRLFDGSLTMHSQPLLILPTKFIPFDAGIRSDTEDYNIYFRFIRASAAFYSFAANPLFDSYRDIIASVDVFMSPQIYTYAQDGWINGTNESPYGSVPPPNPTLLFGGIVKSPNDILKEISNTGNFYKIASIPIDELVNGASNIKLDVENLHTLPNQELMTDDYLSHDKVIADNSFVYNHRLHLTGITRRPFKGFCYLNATSGDQFYEIRDYGTVKTDNSQYVGPQPFLFYPNPKANNIVLYAETVSGPSGYIETRIPLKEHKYLNGSYYIDPDLNNVNVSSVLSGVAQTGTTIQQQGTVFVSEHQNPFIFPVSSRITLPVGKVLAVASNTEAISQGQFGQFPLYVFTDDGIWALEINSEGKYLTRQPVSRDVVINPNIMQMDKALAFVTGKGLTLLSGVDTETISEIIRENNIRSSKISIAGVISALKTAEMLSVDIGDDLMEAYESVPFETFSAGADLAYDYITGGGRILVINPLYDYMYVFDLATSTWSKVLGSYKRVVNNYPDSYVQDGDGKVYNLAHIPDATSTKTTCMIITRPISYEDYNFVIRSLAHRGIFKSALNVVIYASRNGVDYAPIMHRREKLIRMNGSGFRYYKLLVIADLDPNEALSGIEVDFMLKYPNRMR